MSKNPAGKLIAGNKKVIEVSIVKKGARDNCHIKGPYCIPLRLFQIATI
jgi:hypothetical protein